MIVALVAAIVAGVLPVGAHAQAGGDGVLTGRVVDGETGGAVQGATVSLLGSDGAALQTQITGADGSYRFPTVPGGTYDVRFSKAGYRVSTMTDVTITPGQARSADFPLPPTVAASTDEILELDAFVVEATTADEVVDALELRMESDQLLNILSAEDLSRFAASDVADALKRVAGVNIVEGQFAVIRGLDDRYNSTLFNGAPIPSPDPDRQSVQLDLFPSDIVTNLIVSKTFAPELPSNSSGGSIGIVTTDAEAPDEITVKVSSGSGFNSNAIDRFLRFDKDSAVGVESEDANDVIERDYGATIIARRKIFDRQIRLKHIYNDEVDYDTLEGIIESQEPSQALRRRGEVFVSGDLSLGRLTATNGRFDLTESERTQQQTRYVGFGVDLDPEGTNALDFTWFYTKKESESVQLRENGYLPGINYDACAAAQRAENNTADCLTGNPRPGDGSQIGSSAWINDLRDLNEPFARGFFWSDSFADSLSFGNDRELKVYQLNGDHRLPWVEGLRVTWDVNYSETSQDEGFMRLRYAYPVGPGSYTPEGTLPTSIPVEVNPFPGGSFYTTQEIFDNDNDIQETLRFGRIDGEYEFTPAEFVTLRFNSGLWYERAERDVDSTFLTNPQVNGSTQFSIAGDTANDLGHAVGETLDRSGGKFAGSTTNTNESERRINAWYMGSKATFYDRVDLLAGFRRDSLKLTSDNDPFTGQFDPFDGAPKIFPSAYLLFDRRDNPERPFERPIAPPGTVFNDEILNVAAPINPLTGFVDYLTVEELQSVVNGKIDDTKVLPTASLAYRPIEGLAIRGAYSETVARPSFRELGYYVSVDPGTDDLVVGNPQLQLSEVTSWDTRIEYYWGEYGDGVALSLFYKKIGTPIESIVVRDPSDFTGSDTALFQTFFNNPNDATVRGIEIEGRKNFGFLPVDFARYFAISGNFAYIDAKVERTEAEIARTANYFGVAPGDDAKFSDYEKERRLFNQPEWTANADLSFSHPDWGTDLTLAFFAISSVLNAAGTASLNLNGDVFAFTLDRYVDSFYQLDLVFTQRIPVPRLPGILTFKASAKNLTDSERGLIYDEEQLSDEYSERRFKVGRDFSFSLGYTLTF